jgi:hypothetical protein
MGAVTAILVGMVLGVLLAAVPTAHAQVFVDDFNRADSVDLGNGWVEKTPGVFSLMGNQVIKAASATGYADNLVYRPATENMLDGEASVEVRFTSLPPGYAQVFVRGQTGTIVNAGVFDGYLLFTDNDPGRAFLSRIENGAFVPLAQITINPGLNTTDTFRLRLQATGTNPVTLAAFVEQFTGTGWTVIGQATVNDTAPTRVATAGTVGFTGYLEGGVYTYDNFTRTSFDGGGGFNPTPTTTGLSPASAVAGGPGLTLTVNGSGFVTGSVVRWNGEDRPTTYVSATQLTAAIPGTDLGVTGTVPVTVSNPAPGGGTANVQYFSVLDPRGVFLDDFDRPDSAELGNGWREKYPAAFAIQNNEVVMIDTGMIDYHDAIAYRPAGEDLADVEVGLEFRVLPGQNFPQVHARIQRNTIDQSNTLEDYMIFVDGFAASPGRAVIARQAPVPGQFECYMLGIPFPSPLQQTDRYRLRLRVEGANPVTLTGFVDRFDGTAWQAFASGSVVHDNATQPIPGDFCDPGFMPPPITTAGAVGFAKWRTANEVLDTFSWTNLAAPAPNPVPATTSLSPATATAGGPGFTLTVTGTNLVANSVVRWNGADRPTTYASATQLTAAISAADIAVAGTAEVTVVNPAPGGGTSNPQTLTITNPVPTTTGLSPASAVAGGPGFTLTVTGTNLIAGSVVRWNGADRATTYVSATQLAAAIPAADIAVAGTAQITVFNPAPGGGTSNAQTLTITNPVPATTGLNPVFAMAGGPGFTLTVTGRDFVAGSVVRWNGANRATTYVSATQLTAAIPPADIALAGTAAVTVFTPAPGGGASNPQTFTVLNPVPTITSLSPPSVVVGGPQFTLTVTGTNFVRSSVVRWNGADRATTYVSPTQLRAVIPATDILTAGTARVTVFNPPPGGGTSNSVNLVVGVLGGS